MLLYVNTSFLMGFFLTEQISLRESFRYFTTVGVSCLRWWPCDEHFDGSLLSSIPFQNIRSTVRFWLLYLLSDGKVIVVRGRFFFPKDLRFGSKAHPPSPASLRFAHQAGDAPERHSRGGARYRRIRASV